MTAVRSGVMRAIRGGRGRFGFAVLGRRFARSSSCTPADSVLDARERCGTARPETGVCSRVGFWTRGRRGAGLGAEHLLADAGRLGGVFGVVVGTDLAGVVGREHGAAHHDRNAGHLALEELDR